MTVQSQSRHLPPRIHPLELHRRNRVSAKRTITTPGLIVEQHLRNPGAFHAPGGVTHHVLPFRLNQTERQISQVGDQEYDGPYLQGEFLVSPAHVPVFSQTTTESEALVFMAEPAALQQVAAETDSLKPEQVELLSLPKQYDPQITAMATLLLNEMETGGAGGQLYVESVANLFLIHLLRHYCAFQPKLQPYQGGLSSRKLQQAVDYIQMHLSDDLSLATIAAELGMSRYYFCRLFKQSTGISPYQYVIQCRINRAKELLLNHQTSIAEVALQVGFTHQSHFTKHFKRLLGMTPKQMIT